MLIIAYRRVVYIVAPSNGNGCSSRGRQPTSDDDGLPMKDDELTTSTDIMLVSNNNGDYMFSILTYTLIGDE